MKNVEAEQEGPVPVFADVPSPVAPEAVPLVVEVDRASRERQDGQPSGICWAN